MSVIQPFDEDLLRRAIRLALASRDRGGEPFGAVLALDGGIVHESCDRSLELSDPTSHAELAVISAYCRDARRLRLTGYSLYCSAEPCAMCAGAIFWSRLSRLVFSVTQEALRGLSQGPPRPSCAAILNPDGQRIEVVGPLLSGEGLRVFDGFAFGGKFERWQAQTRS